MIGTNPNQSNEYRRTPAIMNFQHLDLNLLKLMTVLYRTRSVTQSSRELALSQPATSHALARLRQALQDDLFVRTPKGLTPTRFCEDIAPGVQQLLHELEQTLQGPAAFDPVKESVHWRVSLSDLGEMMFLPKLVARIRQHAPLSTLSNVSVSVDEVAQALESRTIDLALGILPNRHKGIRSHALFQENYVALTAPNLFAGHRRLNLEKFRQSRFAIASPTATFHRGLDKVLRDLQVASRISVRAKHFGALPELIRDTDLTAIVPRMYAESVIQHMPLKMWNLPIPALHYTVNLQWHMSTDKDLSQVWLRQQVVDLFDRKTE